MFCASQFSYNFLCFIAKTSAKRNKYEKKKTKKQNKKKKNNDGKAFTRNDWFMKIRKKKK